jgi:hypothetical protein
VKNKSEEVVSLEKDGSKYINNIPQEFLIPRLSFKTDQIISYFTQDIIYLIWKKYKDITKPFKIYKII